VPTPTARVRRARRGGAGRLVRLGRAVWANAGFALLAVAVLATMVAIGVAARNAPAQAGQDQSAVGPQWIPLRSSSPADIIAAIRQSRLFNLDRSGTGDQLHDLSHVGTPQLVREVQPNPRSPGADCYALPILSASGATVGVAIAWLNATHSAVYIGYIRDYDQPQTGWPVGLPGAAQAVAVVQGQHQARLRAGGQPELVYFPFDFRAQWSGTLSWHAGGEGPDDPIWRVPGDDGRDHFVGTNGRAYYLNELPLAAGAA
jgi:hypothetical protein